VPLVNFLKDPGLYKINPSSKEIWLESNESEKSLGEFINLIYSASKEIKLVCGELDPKIYEDEKVIKAFKSFLEKKGKLKIIFSSDCKEFEDSHPKLYKLIYNNGFQELVSLYTAKKRPIQHFTLADTKNILIEAPNHAPFGSRSSIIIYDDGVLGEILEEKFDSYINKLGSANECPI